MVEKGWSVGTLDEAGHCLGIPAPAIPLIMFGGD